MAHRRHLRNYLLDRKFQLRFTVLIVLIACVLTAGLGYFWYDEMRKASRIVEVKALATMSDAEVAKVQADLHRQDKIRLAILGGFGVAIAFVLAGFSIIFTHKVAGPLFKISRHLRDIRYDNLQEVWDLRKGDQLQEFWGGFKGMHRALRERLQSDIKALEEGIAALSNADGEQQKAALAALTALRDFKASSLEGGHDVPDDA
ncbi:MAG: hypothetical protein CSA65_02745 [Proteobacteria bacterium]|nr:MAG: hypothetical protein CSB49_01300 [Pseudomonadota bacterium]PIE19314.1 MAG: hypothetical protein CSA65_02745 [Pseudomonadota bacterium]